MVVTNWDIKPGTLDYPLVIAHRGEHSSTPENTVPSFLRAFEIGCDGIELDVHLSRDGHVVVFHDRVLDRMTNATGAVGARTLKELQSLDVIGPNGYQASPGTIPTLDEVLDALPPTYLVCIEMKARIARMRALPIKVETIIRKHNRTAPTMVHSFNPVSLFYLRLLDRRITRGFIWTKRHPYPLRKRWLSPLAKAHWQDPADHTFTPTVLDHFHAQGKPVLAWDKDAGTDMEQLRRLGLDGVVSNNPGYLVSQKKGKNLL